MLAMEVGLGLFGHGTWVPRYPEYGPEVECVWDAHRLFAPCFSHPCPPTGPWVCVLTAPYDVSKASKL